MLALDLYCEVLNIYLSQLRDISLVRHVQQTMSASLSTYELRLIPLYRETTGLLIQTLHLLV